MSTTAVTPMLPDRYTTKYSVIIMGDSCLLSIIADHCLLLATWYRIRHGTYKGTRDETYVKELRRELIREFIGGRTPCILPIFLKFGKSVKIARLFSLYQTPYFSLVVVFLE